MFWLQVWGKALSKQCNIYWFAIAFKGTNYKAANLTNYNIIVIISAAENRIKKQLTNSISLKVSWHLYLMGSEMLHPCVL